MTTRLSFAVLAVSAAALAGIAACGANDSPGSADVHEGGASNPGGSAGASVAGVAGVAGTMSDASSGFGGSASAGGAGQSGTSPGGGAESAGSSGSGGNASAGAPGGTSGSGGSAGSSGGSGSSGSSGNAGAGGAAGSGPTAYNPCPTDGNPCKILPFGDSITEGVKSSDGAGYRSQLFKLVVAAKRKVTFTGSLTAGPTQVSGQTFPRQHEGHAGWTIDPGYSEYGNVYGGISSLVPSPALSGGPHIVLLHIGANELFPTKDGTAMATRLDALVEKVAQGVPSALIVLAQITPVGTSNNGHTQAQVDAANAAQVVYNGKIPGIIQAHLAKGQHLIGVDMSKMPLSDLTTASVHPNDQGYAYMAGIWYAAIKDLLPQ